MTATVRSIALAIGMIILVIASLSLVASMTPLNDVAPAGQSN